MRIDRRKNYKAGPKDECGTPPYGIVPIINHIEWYRIGLSIPQDEFVIWDPAIGFHDKIHKGIVDGLSAFGYTTIGTSDDFLTITIDEINARVKESFGPRHKVRMIVTNPPYSVGLKRAFINTCQEHFEDAGIPYGLLMTATTLNEKRNGLTLKGCAIHIPFGRINFGMPNKGWGTKEEPTKATFETTWYTKGISDPYQIWYDDFDMSDHFKALDVFEKFKSRPYWTH